MEVPCLEGFNEVPCDRDLKRIARFPSRARADYPELG
jgi:hypothetical protein